MPTRKTKIKDKIVVRSKITFSRWLASSLVVLAVALNLVGCRTERSQNELVVSAAISLKDAFDEIALLSQTRSGTWIHFNYGASGMLEKQIELGAPVDVFASAGAVQMDELAAKNMIVPGSRSDFARNSLVLIVPANASLVAAFDDLNRPAINKIAIGNPKTVPAGQYTEQTLNKLKLLPQIQPKLIFGEDVRQVLDYVVRNEVDAGIVYSSDALSAGSKTKVVARAADDSHDPILYPIAVVKESKQQEAARKFIELVLSSEGQGILAKHGFVAIK